MGVLVLITAKLITEADPIVMGVIYFSLFTLAGKITSGFFTPFGPLAANMLGFSRLTEDLKSECMVFLQNWKATKSG
jgi:hypothetical protein